MVRDAYACSAPDVTLNFTPLLSLNADQNKKFIAKCIGPNSFSIHLDTYKDFQERQALCDLILNIGNDTSVVIFCTAPKHSQVYPFTTLFLIPRLRMQTDRTLALYNDALWVTFRKKQQDLLCCFSVMYP